MSLLSSDKLHGEAFNFGPRAEQNRTVVDLLGDLGSKWGIKNPNDIYQVIANVPFHEAGLLKLNCDKALYHLKWAPTLSYSEMVDFISNWYGSYYRGEPEMLAITTDQIDMYERAAVRSNISWVD